MMRCVIALLAGLVLAAQEPSFDVQSRLVLVPVTVTDAKGRTVEGLGEDDFELLDNGKPQSLMVDTFGTGVAPVALVVAVQASGISAPALDKVRKIGSVISQLITGERGCAGLLAFSARVRWLADCTSDIDTFTRAFDRLEAGDEKAGRMLDGVAEAVSHLRQRAGMRRVLLLISESRDRGSQVELEPVLLAAQREGVVVYAATYSAFKTAWTARPAEPPADRLPPPLPPRPPVGEPAGRSPNGPLTPPGRTMDLGGALSELKRLGDPKTVELLARGTGGAVFSFVRQKGLEECIEKLGTELHSQYVLSFVPQKPAGLHRLEVRVRRGGDVRVRARPSYWSTGEW